MNQLQYIQAASALSYLCGMQIKHCCYESAIQNSLLSLRILQVYSVNPRNTDSSAEDGIMCVIRKAEAEVKLLMSSQCPSPSRANVMKVSALHAAPSIERGTFIALHVESSEFKSSAKNIARLLSAITMYNLGIASHLTMIEEAQQGFQFQLSNERCCQIFEQSLTVLLGMDYSTEENEQLRQNTLILSQLIVGYNVRIKQNPDELNKGSHHSTTEENMKKMSVSFAVKNPRSGELVKKTAANAA
jgi:hypothetical protein